MCLKGVGKDGRWNLQGLATMIPTILFIIFISFQLLITLMYDFKMYGLGDMERKVNILARVDTIGFFNNIETEM